MRHNVIATANACGESANPADSPQALAHLRADELRCATDTLGIADLMLDYPDGGADRWDMAALAGQLTKHIRSIRPDVVVAHDDQGITRHPDHIALHSAVRMALDGPADRLGVQRLFYQVITCPEEASPEEPTFACIAPNAVDVTVDIAAFEPVKCAAQHCHRTQAADTAHMLDRPAAGCDDLLTGL